MSSSLSPMSLNNRAMNLVDSANRVSKFYARIPAKIGANTIATVTGLGATAFQTGKFALSVPTAVAYKYLLLGTLRVLTLNKIQFLKTGYNAAPGLVDCARTAGKVVTSATGVLLSAASVVTLGALSKINVIAQHKMGNCSITRLEEQEESRKKQSKQQKVLSKELVQNINDKNNWKNGLTVGSQDTILEDSVALRSDETPAPNTPSALPISSLQKFTKVDQDYILEDTLALRTTEPNKPIIDEVTKQKLEELKPVFADTLNKLAALKAKTEADFKAKKEDINFKNGLKIADQDSILEGTQALRSDSVVPAQENNKVVKLVLYDKEETTLKLNPRPLPRTARA